jgi:outer membrane protein OmpA-like peptidoglycan-associated protein
MIELVGHTDSIGSSEYNRTLGMKRAISTKQYLLDQGIAGDDLDIASEGEKKPLEDNASADGRNQNRRVEIF